MATLCLPVDLKTLAVCFLCVVQLVDTKSVELVHENISQRGEGELKQYS